MATIDIIDPDTGEKVSLNYNWSWQPETNYEVWLTGSGRKGNLPVTNDGSTGIDFDALLYRWGRDWLMLEGEADEVLANAKLAASGLARFKLMQRELSID